jgi:hypothetical protein
MKTTKPHKSTTNIQNKSVVLIFLIVKNLDSFYSSIKLKLLLVIKFRKCVLEYFE